MMRATSCASEGTGSRMKTIARFAGLLLASLSLPASSWAQGAAPDLRGIYVYSSDVSQISAGYAKNVTSALHLTGTDGIVLVVAWSALEPAPGQYQWSTLDSWIAQAVASARRST
jgi:hypothetical protein